MRDPEARRICADEDVDSIVILPYLADVHLVQVRRPTKDAHYISFNDSVPLLGFFFFLLQVFRLVRFCHGDFPLALENQGLGRCLRRAALVGLDFC